MFILVMEMPESRDECSSCHGYAWGLGVTVLLVMEMPGE